LNKAYLIKSFTFLLILLLPQLFIHHTVFAHQDENENVVNIHINEEGFEPNNVIIDLGTKVVFENTGLEGHWPAVDEHPSHTMYDGTTLDEHCAEGATPVFDSCGPINSQGSWSYTFTKEGFYGYHDHLWPQFYGEIIVKDPNKIEPEKNFFTDIINFFKQVMYVISSFFNPNKNEVTLKTGNKNSDYYTSLKTKYEEIVVNENPREAIKALRDESSKNNDTLAFCHDVLHAIGHTAYTKYGSFKNAVEFQEDFCNSGYIHGLFETYFDTVENPLDGLAEQCRDFGEGKREFDLWQCYHGIGHGFMYLTGGDLDESLYLCSNNLPSINAVSSCQNGVYMEVFNLEILAKEKELVDPVNPLLTCSKRQEGSQDCYLYIPTYLSQTAGMEYTNIFSECAKLEAVSQITCITGVGSEAIKRNMNDVNSVYELCQKAGSYINQAACASGVVSMYMNQNGSLEAGKELCKITPEYYKDICNSTVSSQESFFK